MTTKSRAELILFGTTFIWGGTFTVVKIGMVEISPILLTALRFTIATLVILPLLWRTIFPLTFPLIRKGALLGFFLFLGFTTQNIGLTMTTASKSAFITGTMVLFVPILQLVIERKAPKLGNLLGILVVTVGLWLLTSPEGAALNVGDLLTFGCAIVFAAYIVYMDVISAEMHTSQLVFLQIITVGVLSWVSLAGWETPRFGFGTATLLSLAYLTFLATVLTTWLQTRYQKDTTPTRAVVIFSIEPVWASAIAAVVLGEALGVPGILGGTFIIVGILVSELSDRSALLSRPVGGRSS